MTPDDPPDGWPPEGWDAQEAQICYNTHCCTLQWWVDLYGPTIGPYARFLTCDWPGLNILKNCPPEGGKPQ